MKLRLADDYCTRRLVAICLFVGALSVPYVLHHTLYPYPAFLPWIAEYFFRTQDVAGAVLLLVLVVAALVAPWRSTALELVERIGRHPWRVAALTFVLLCLGTLFIERNHPLPQDEYAALFQSRVFAAGRLTGQFPPELLGRLVPPNYLNQFIYGSFQTGAVASAYWPGFALLLTPFSWIGAPWACNPLLASLSVVLIGRLAARLSGAAQAGGWAMLLALASPAFTASAITYFSMSAHLLFNLLFAWLLLQVTPGRLVLAGVVGSFALVLHNPLPHTLFALPWIAWLAWQPRRWRNLFALAAGYLPLGVLLGLGWPLLLSKLLGATSYALFPSTGEPLHDIANFFWNWHIKLRSAIQLPDASLLEIRAAEAFRLWNWAVPGLLVLAAVGWWLHRRDWRARLLGLSVVSTMLGYLLIVYTQGHGWGARYLHPAWGAFPVLAALALVRLGPASRCEHTAGYVAALALLSLVFSTGLRALQIREYLDAHLAHRPPVVAGARQVVFIREDRTGGYQADLVQNDPFLRGPVVTMLSAGEESDTRLMRSRFPGARLWHRDARGDVWLLGPDQGQLEKPSRSQSESRPRSSSTPAR
jgi:hypothetical protein